MREVVFFTQIIIPFLILVYCTVHIVKRLKKKTVGDKTKLRRAVILVTTVMVVFSLCFLPCTIARMVLLIVRVQELPDSVQNIAAVAFDGLMVLSYMDCLLDPLVYCFCSTKFKEIYLSNYFPFLVKRVPHEVSSSTGHTVQPTCNKVLWSCWNLFVLAAGQVSHTCTERFLWVTVTQVDFHEKGTWR